MILVSIESVRYLFSCTRTAKFLLSPSVSSIRNRLLPSIKFSFNYFKASLAWDVGVYPKTIQ